MSTPVAQQRTTRPSRVPDRPRSLQLVLALAPGICSCRTHLAVPKHEFHGNLVTRVLFSHAKWAKQKWRWNIMGEAKGRREHEEINGPDEKARANPNQPIPISADLPLRWTTHLASPAAQPRKAPLPILCSVIDAVWTLSVFFCSNHHRHQRRRRVDWIGQITLSPPLQSL